MEPQTFGMGWHNDPVAVTQVMDAWAASGLPVTFAHAAPNLMRDTSDDAPVFFWDAEKSVLGAILGPWNQRQVGSCVGHGSGRAAQDLMLWEIFSGDAEQYPGTQVAPEVIYAGSRVEIGGGRLGSSDGSVGAWAAEFLKRFGVVVRGKYGSLDLTTYSETVCRQLGARGLGTEIEGIARQHPVTAAAMVQTREEGWAAIGGGKPVFVCSNQGFRMTLDSDGYCSPSGEWGHCLTTRARFVHPNRGRSVVIGNSWDDYLASAGRTVHYIATDGSVKEFTLPGGSFCASWETWGNMLGQRDSFALAGFSGWKRTSPVSYEP